MSRLWRSPATEEGMSTRESAWPIGFARTDGDGATQAPVDPSGLMIPSTPASPIQALMEAPPHTEPVESLGEQSVLRDELADALDELDPRLRWVFQAKVNRGLSFSQIARELAMSKSAAHQLFGQAQRRLAEILEDAPAVQARLGGRMAAD